MSCNTSRFPSSLTPWAATNREQSDYLLSFVHWYGASAGAGLSFTSLTWIEFDLNNMRRRTIRRQSGQDNLIVPYNHDIIHSIVNEQPWDVLTEEQAASVREAIRLWLDTNPPSEYMGTPSLGDEDGMVVRMTVEWGTNSVTTEINPYGSEEVATDEWFSLLQAIGIRPGINHGQVFPR